ncbi:MAG: tetratricopeptide repeat protein [Planctomycetota bacterium]|nr:MAG: tetratricopeptide repeat protein [Planctomycetota bacterium]
MASRVNVKFVVILSTVLVLVAAGTGFLAYKVVFKSAADLAAAGDAKMASGEIRAAELLYSKAVNKDPYNSELLLKWENALEQWTPETDRELQNEFRNTYVLLRRQLALSDNRTNIDYQIEYADLLWQLASISGFSRTGYESVINACDEQIPYHQTTSPDDPSWLPLRRYRGLSYARIKLNGLDLSEEDREQTEADLLAVLEADPTDYEVLETIVAMKQIDAAKASELGRRTEAERIDEESAALVDSFLETNGDDSIGGVQANILRTQIEFRQAASALVAEFGPAATPKIEALTAEYQETTADLAAQVAALDPAEVDRDAVLRVYNLESLTDTSRTYASVLPIVTRARQARPNDPLLALTHAEILRARGDFDETFEVLESVIDRPRLPLGLESIMLIQAKSSAIVSQVQTAVEAHTKAETDADKAQWLTRAKDSRAALAQIVAETSPAIQLLDARIAVAENDFVTAQRLVTAYNQFTNDTDTEALWLAARVAQQLGQSGNTRSALERILVLDPTMAAANVALAEVEYNLGRLEAARARLLQAQNSNPDDPYVRERLALIEQRLGNREAADPVQGAIFNAQRVAGGSETEISDVAAATSLLQQAISELGPDPRLFIEKARLEMLSRNPEAARATIQQALEAHPENADLQRIARGIEGTGSIEKTVETIMASDRSDVQKQITIYAAYLQEGDRAQANAALDRAAEIEPNNPTVLELLFNRASEAKDIAEAKRIADRARAANADRLDGLSYRARVLLLEGKDQDALAALTQAVASAPNDTQLLALLAQTQIGLGRTADGINSLRRALDVRPDDLRTIMRLCQVLSDENRMTEALEVARRSEIYGRADPDFMQMVLTLEGSVGDKAAARDRREKILEARPDDYRNRLALIDLYISLGQWDKGADLITQTRSHSGDTPGVREALVTLEARWNAEQNDLDTARRVFAKFIAETPPADRVGPYAALAQFMMQRGSSNAAITAMRQAARYQPEGEFGIDLMLGGTLMRFSRFSEAYEAYKRILDNDPNADVTVKLRVCEALIGMGKLDEAEQMLASIPGGESDITVNLLRARVALQRNDDRQARAILDAAVSRWPNDFRVWVLRAEAEARVESLIPDALADLNRAIEIDPTLAEAHRRRAELLAKLGREDEAIKAWQDAVRLNPTNEELRSALLVTMIRRGMEAEAVQAAEEWFERRPRDAQHRTRIAELFILGGMRRAGTDIYLGAFQIDQQPQLVLRLVDLLLGENPARLGEAERVFTEAKAVVVTDPSLMLGRARVFAQTGRMEAAINDCLGSFQLLTDRSADRMAFWFTTMRSVFSNSRETLAFIRQLESQPGAADWAKLFTCRVLTTDPATASQGVSQLRTLIDSTRNIEVKYSALRALAGEHYFNKDYEQALTIWKQTLALKPTDWQVENNIAFVLAQHLDNPEGALPYAESASKHAPNEPEVLDTLGTVYMTLGRPEDAVPLFAQAVSQTRGNPEDAKYMLRHAQALLASKNPAAARVVVAEVQGLLDRGRQLDEENQTILQDLVAQLGDG